jgi:flavin reductase (DIM6/NTAB) family NADH-FMN oxidoreductase RutF
MSGGTSETSETSETPDQEAFDSLVASADPPMVVVTTAAEGERAGCLVGFHSQASIGPRRYGIWLSKANHTYRVALRAGHLAVHFLSADDLQLAERFGTTSGEDTDKFAGLELAGTPYDVPLLAACPRRALLERIAVLDDGGDHVCVTTRVLTATSPGSFTPLRVSQVAHLTPGRPAEARVIDPHD